MTLKNINILEYAFGEGGGGHQKAYAVYAFVNVDNCERPLRAPETVRIAMLRCVLTAGFQNFGTFWTV